MNFFLVSATVGGLKAAGGGAGQAQRHHQAGARGVAHHQQISALSPVWCSLAAAPSAAHPTHRTNPGTRYLLRRPRSAPGWLRDSVQAVLWRAWPHAVFGAPGACCVRLTACDGCL